MTWRLEAPKESVALRRRAHHHREPVPEQQAEHDRKRLQRGAAERDRRQSDQHDRQ
jgi:hypothetical protein